MALVELPEGQRGDMLWNNGTEWVLLKGPIADPSVLSNMVLQVDAGSEVPAWDFIRASSEVDPE